MSLIVTCHVSVCWCWLSCDHYLSSLSCWLTKCTSALSFCLTSGILLHPNFLLTSLVAPSRCPLLVPPSFLSLLKLGCLRGQAMPNSLYCTYSFLNSSDLLMSFTCHLNINHSQIYMFTYDLHLGISSLVYVWTKFLNLPLKTYSPQSLSFQLIESYSDCWVKDNHLHSCLSCVFSLLGYLVGSTFRT